MLGIVVETCNSQLEWFIRDVTIDSVVQAGLHVNDLGHEGRALGLNFHFAT